MTERIYTYPDGTRQRVGSDLDAVPVANATERTAPKFDPVGWSRNLDRMYGQHLVDRAELVALLDAWQAYTEAHEPGIDVEGPGYAAAMRAQTWDALLEALGDFADGVTP